MADCPGGGRSMGLDYGLNNDTFDPKRKFRWLFKLTGVSAEDTSISMSLPPRRGARPSLGWRESEIQHVTEIIWYPWKPEWKPINLILYDTRCHRNPVFDWVRLNEQFRSPGMYDPKSATWTPIVDGQLKRTAFIEMYNGCGICIEKWQLDNCYPSSIDWGELDMDAADIVTVELQIRYDRAYIIPCAGGTASGSVAPSGGATSFGGDNGSQNQPSNASQAFPSGF